MKKILLIAAIAGLTMTSCKKDYKCGCTYTATYTGFVAGPEQVTTIYGVSKKQASANCIKTTGTSTFGSTSYTWTDDCKLK